MLASPWRVGVLVCLVGIVVALAIWVAKNSDRFQQKLPQGLYHPVVGQRLSRLRLEPLTARDDQIKLSDLEGKVVIINFWATWCAPCWQELPHIAALQAQYRNRQDVMILSVSSVEGHSDLASLRKETVSVLARFRTDLPTFADPDSDTLIGLPDAIGKSGYPKTLVLDRQGTIRGTWEGFSPDFEDSLKRLVEELVNSN